MHRHAGPSTHEQRGRAAGKHRDAPRNGNPRRHGRYEAMFAKRHGQHRRDDGRARVLHRARAADIGTRQRCLLIQGACGDRKNREHRDRHDEPLRRRLPRLCRVRERRAAPGDLRREHERHAGKTEHEAAPGTRRKPFAEHPRGDGRREERLKRAQKRHDARAHSLRDGPVARAQINALQQRAREEMPGGVASCRPGHAGGESQRDEQQRRADEAREQIQVRVDVRRDRPRDDKACRPEKHE